MRGRFLAAVAFALCAVLMNGAQAENIAPGLKVIVLDAGHGGKFPGAHYGKVYEKDLTLAVVLRLGRLIEQGMPGVKVVYTRKTDKELGATLLDDLQARADIANGAGGELFVSVHVNAAAATSARGVETLIMGETPKEQRYNENALYESNREDLIDMSDERTAAIVRAYIQNLQFTYGEYSMAMARCIQSRYGKAGRHLRGIKPQLLRVLYATDMPGVLTEIGFMSNPQEMAYMKSDRPKSPARSTTPCATTTPTCAARSFRSSTRPMRRRSRRPRPFRRPGSGRAAPRLRSVPIRRCATRCRCLRAPGRLPSPRRSSASTATR